MIEDKNKADIENELNLSFDKTLSSKERNRHAKSALYNIMVLYYRSIFQNMQVPEASTIFEYLLYFGNENLDEAKMKWTAFLINKYYPVFLNKKLQYYTSEEEYEMCSKIIEWQSYTAIQENYL